MRAFIDMMGRYLKNLNPIFERIEKVLILPKTTTLYKKIILFLMVLLATLLISLQFPNWYIAKQMEYKSFAL